ncbi:MAG TPA: DNA/RNA non-specific endonuclease [Nevskiaceae bacterium]|nr:DNA/RNA non-specific endonuclease [Nevskiaceae bacterium]
MRRARIPRRLTPISLLVAAAAFIWFWIAPTSSPDVFAGFPHIEDRWLRWSTHVLQNPGFAIGYSEWYRDPLWVAFRAHALPPGESPGRRDHFDVDSRTLARVSSEDYRASGFDRGHLAPNFLMARLYGERAQTATFLMSNITPQKPRLNQLLWQRIEEAEADIVAPHAKELWVITGPVFDRDARLRSGVEIPSAFFRIWLDRDAQGALHAIAFLAPQSVHGDETLTKFVVTVRDVEEKSGLDFFPELPSDEQDRIESVAAPAYWLIPRFADAPPRYAENFRDRDE